MTGRRSERAVQLALAVGVGGVAGAAAFSHVRHLAVVHGQPGWLAVADALVIETLAVAAGLEIRRRRLSGERIAPALAVLVAAVVLSLAAQVAEAERSPWGWIMAAVPAVGFLVMVKLALSGTAQVRTSPGPDPQVQQVRQVHPEPEPEPEVPPATAAGDDELLAAGLAVLSDLERSGVVLTRSSLLNGLRTRGVRVSTDRGTALLKQLQSMPRTDTEGAS